MTALNSSLITRPSTPSVSPTIDHSAKVSAYVLQTVITVGMAACVVFEDSRLCTTEECQARRLFVRGSLFGMIPLLSLLSDKISLQKEVLSKEKPKKEKQKILLEEQQKRIRLTEELKIVLEGSLSLFLFVMPNFDEDVPRLRITATLLMLNTLQDGYMKHSGKTIPEFFYPLIKRIDSCRVRLIQSRSSRSTIATTRSAAQAALASSSRPDSRCRRIYNGMWSVVTTCVNGVKRGFDCKRKPVNEQASNL